VRHRLVDGAASKVLLETQRECVVVLRQRRRGDAAWLDQIAGIEDAMEAALRSWLRSEAQRLSSPGR
jgi:hypothetical protein